MFVPDNTNVPTPAFVNAPEVLFPEFPDIVNVCPEVETFMVLVVAAVREKALFVLAEFPVY